MVKISFIASGIILGLATISSASASLISRSFLDQALTDYATNTALDLKADQSDFTELNTQISGSVDILRQLFEQTSNSYELVNGINPEKFPNTISGAFTLLHQYLDAFARSISYGWTDSTGTYYAGFRELNNGWTDSEKKTYLGVKGLNDKIGTLPTETAMSSCSVWRAIDLTQNEMPETIGGILEQLYSAGHVSGSCTHDGYNGPSLPNIIRRLIYGYTYNGGTAMMGINGLNVGSIDSTGNVIEPGLRQITNGWTDAKGGVIMNPGLKGMYGGWTDSGSNTYLGVMGLNDKIGTLPSGSLLNQTPFTDDLYKFTQGTDNPVYPNSMAELVKQIYGESLGSGIQPGLVHLLITGFSHNGGLPINSDDIGILPAMSLAEAASSKATTAQTTANTANETAQANTAKIGTVPDGKNLAGMISETDAKISTLPSGSLLNVFDGRTDVFYKNAQRTDTPVYPTSLEEFVQQIYGIPGSPLGVVPQLVINIGILESTVNGVKAVAQANTAKIGTVPDGKNLAGMISETDAKIGDLPTEYATVGAALTAMDAKIDARELPSTSDDGQYVLSAKKVGDTITYTWVKMDLTNEEQAQ